MRSVMPIVLFLLIWWSGFSNMEMALRLGIYLSIIAMFAGVVLKIRVLKREAQVAQEIRPRRRRRHHKQPHDPNAEPPPPDWYKQLPRKDPNGHKA